MKRNHSFLSPAIIVVIAVVVSFSFSNLAFANEDLAANIGIVAKHHSEQISDKDVVLADEETADMSNDQNRLGAKVLEFERAAIGQRPLGHLEPLNKEFKWDIPGNVELSRPVGASPRDLMGAVDMFLKLTGIEGEGSDSVH